jgi:hypothetical protein
MLPLLHLTPRKVRGLTLYFIGPGRIKTSAKYSLQTGQVKEKKGELPPFSPTIFKPRAMPEVDALQQVNRGEQNSTWGMR